MPNWKNASKSDLKRLFAIQMLLLKRPDIVDQLFHPTEACLQTSPENIMRGLSSGEQTLVTLAVDIWRDSDESRTQCLMRLDAENFKNTIDTLEFLRKPWAT